MFKKLRKNEKGFTLAELLIVVAIIGVLVAISIPIFTTQLEKAREATDLANIRSAYAEVSANVLTEEGAVTEKKEGNVTINAVAADATDMTATVTLTQKKDNNLIISVIDHGCGMTKEVQKKLFNTMITTKGKNGTGLGMFMSYSTIKGHFNGDITFETEVNKGTTFNVILPLK